MRRAFILAVLIMGVAAPSAHAAIADRYIPYYEAADGVRGASSADGQLLIRFGPKAAKLYATIAGRSADVKCGAGEGNSMGMRGVRVPRRRATLRLGFPAQYADLCVVSTRRLKTDETCLPPEPEAKLCARVVFAMTDAGRTRLDKRMREIDLSVGAIIAATALSTLPPEEAAKVLDANDIVGLPSPDASPPAGKIGYYDDGHTAEVVALLRDGKRLFVRNEGDEANKQVVQSTNVPAFMILGGEDVFAVL